MAVPLSVSRLRTPAAANPVSASGAVRASSALTKTVTPRLVSTPRRKLATPTIKMKSPMATPEAKDRGLIGGALASIGNVISFPGTVIKSLPTLIGKGAQSLVGLGETVFDIGADIINPNLYTSRSEVDLAKGRALGLKGEDLLAYSMQRTVPLIAPMVSSVPKTGRRLAELGTLGLVDTGAPGFDYYRALRRGELGTMALEDLGNIVLAGRAAGLGNLGVQAGGRIAAAGAPRLGATISTIGRFAEEPIATSVKGVARAGLRVPKTTIGPMPRESMLSTIAQSERPLQTLVGEAGLGFRNMAERRVQALDEARRKSIEARLLAEREGRTADVAREARNEARIDDRRSFWLRLSQSQERARTKVRTGQVQEEAVGNTFNQMALQYGQRGSVPESTTQLRSRAENLRLQAEGQNDPALQAQLVQQADFLERKAAVKEANPEKLNDKENRTTNFSAAVIVVSKLIDQIMADRRAGKSMDEIMATIRPRELMPEVARQGYEYTPAAVQRAIDFVEGRLDDVDKLDMDVASSMMSSFAGYLEGLVTKPGTLVGGVLSPAQFGDSPVPENVLSALNGKPYESSVLMVLDGLAPDVIVEYFPELVVALADSFEKPAGLFTKLASSRPDSAEYSASRVILMLGAELMSDPQTSIFTNTPRTAVQVAEFFANPAIYPARLRPMAAYRVSRAQEGGARDINNTLYGLRQLANEFPELFSEQRLKKLSSLLDEMTDPRRQFDRDFYKGVQDFLAGVLRDIEKNKKKTGARQGVVKGRIAESDARLAEVEAQARAAAGMVEQALLRPEELSPEATAETQTLRQQADELRTEAGRLASQPDPLTTLRQNIATETDKLDVARSNVAEQETGVRQLEERLAVEQKLLDDAALDEEGMVLLLAELDEAANLSRSGIGVDPTMSEQKAWKQQKQDEQQAQMDFWEQQFLSLSPGYVSDIEPGRFGTTKATATGGVQEVNIKRQGGFQLNRAFLDSPDYVEYVLRGIPNPTHRRRFYRDHTVRGMRLDEASGVEVPTKGSTLGEAAGQLTEEEFLTRLTEAYTNYMNARDEFTRIKNMPFKGKYGEQVKEAMVEDQRAVLDEQPWQNPLTGEEVRGVRPLRELRRIEQIARDQDTLAEQVRLVRSIQNELQTKRASLENARRDVQSLDRRIGELSARATGMEGSSPRVQAARLTSEAQRMTDEAARLEAENVRLRPAVAKERVMLTRESGKRLRVANARRLQGREVTGYEFTKGVAKKLDEAQTAELREQQRLFEENRRLQQQFNDQDSALGEGVAIRQGAQEYVGALGEPTPRATLQAATQRPRLLGETDQPTWIPVGESSGVRPIAAMDVVMRGEGMAPESKISIERQRQSTYMAQTPAQFAARMKDILRQVARNRVVARIIEDEMLTSNVDSIIPEPRRLELAQQADQMVQEQGYNRGTKQYDSIYDKTYGDLVIVELNLRGYEPVSPVVMPDEGDVYAGRAPLGTLSQIVSGDEIKPTTLVMRRGLRESLSSYFEPKGGSRIPPRLAAVFEFVGRNTAKWKSVVLPFSLRWQVGDAMGNIINAHVRAGISPIELARRVTEISQRLREPEGLTKRQLMFGDTLGSNVADPVIQVLLGAGLQAYGIRLSDLKEMHPSGTLKPPPGASYGGGFRPFFPGFREKSFAFNETQNGIVRSAVAVAKLEEALQKRGRNINEIDPVTIHNDPVLYEAVRDAVEQANDALGNFSQLSPYEKQFVRTVYPFWSWVKFINKAAAQLLISQPDRVLFYGHLGSMVTGDDGNDLYDWLKNQTAVPIPGLGTFLIDLSFTNPYSDAILMGRSPFEESAEVATNISPILRAGLRTGGEIAYGISGRRFPLFETVSRPGYLEGRPGTTTRGLGDVLGGIAYQNFRTFAGPYRFLTDVAPTWRIPGTDVTLGPGPRYGQGSVRSTGVYARPLLSPTQERIGAIFQGLGVPVPSARLSEAQAQGREIRRTGVKSLRRREKERRLARIRQ